MINILSVFLYDYREICLENVHMLNTIENSLERDIQKYIPFVNGL